MLCRSICPDSVLFQGIKLTGFWGIGQGQVPFFGIIFLTLNSVLVRIHSSGCSLQAGIKDFVVSITWAEEKMPNGVSRLIRNPQRSF